MIGYLELNDSGTKTSAICVALSVSTTNSVTTGLGVPGCTSTNVRQRSTSIRNLVQARWSKTSSGWMVSPLDTEWKQCRGTDHCRTKSTLLYGRRCRWTQRKPNASLQVTTREPDWMRTSPLEGRKGCGWVTLNRAIVSPHPSIFTPDPLSSSVFIKALLRIHLCVWPFNRVLTLQQT